MTRTRKVATRQLSDCITIPSSPARQRQTASRGCAGQVAKEDASRHPGPDMRARRQRAPRELMQTRRAGLAGTTAHSIVIDSRSEAERATRSGSPCAHAAGDVGRGSTRRLYRDSVPLNEIAKTRAIYTPITRHPRHHHCQEPSHCRHCLSARREGGARAVDATSGSA